MGENQLKKQSELTLDQAFNVMAQALEKGNKEGAFTIGDAAIIKEAIEVVGSFVKGERENREAAKEVPVVQAEEVN